VVFGQDKAIESLSASIKLARAGLREPEKPIGSYLFSGPTGVGKTEVAKQLAASLGVELLRFDMSEYMERHTVSRLIGAPPGYVGFDQGGLLTDGVDQHPHCVVLLDEIEKAHPDLYNVLLQIMDHGRLTDHNGKQVNFRNVILIMTTNAGAADLARQAFGFTRNKREGDDHEAINRQFAPEFRNRLDAIVSFAHLNADVIGMVVEKFVLQLEAQLADRDVTIELSEPAKAWLIEHGYDEQMGARPMARVIQEHIKKPLADEGAVRSAQGRRPCPRRAGQGRGERGRQGQDRLRVRRGPGHAEAGKAARRPQAQAETGRPQRRRRLEGAGLAGPLVKA
jgi:ATP-dependent Clp protease ATP-binding subunit ClpA